MVLAAQIPGNRCADSLKLMGQQLRWLLFRPWFARARLNLKCIEKHEKDFGVSSERTDITEL